MHGKNARVETLKVLETAVSLSIRKRREGVRGQGRLDGLLYEALVLIKDFELANVLRANNGH